MQTDAFVLTSPGKPLERQAINIAEPNAHEAIIEVEACGICHTDLGFADGSVAPRHAIPLVLGHEIVGRIVQTGQAAEHLKGKRVIVPAVMPCGECVFCKAGRGNACLTQKMPGNDIHGGFAQHVVVPTNCLVNIDDAPASVDTRELSVVADAVSTAYQGIRRAQLAKGDLAIVVGSGGVGGYTIQIAKSMGARVIACDINDGHLEMISKYGAEKTINVSGRAPKDVRKEVQGLAKQWQIPSLNFKIFECSGTADGQTLAYTLLAHAATVVFVGYSAKPVEVRLSNLMAFDATAHGTWGCPPEIYPEVLRLIYNGEVVITPFIEFAPMSRLPELLDDMAHHRLSRRMIVDPRT